MSFIRNVQPKLLKKTVMSEIIFIFVILVTNKFIGIFIFKVILLHLLL